MENKSINLYSQNYKLYSVLKNKYRNNFLENLFFEKNALKIAILFL